MNEAWAPGPMQLAHEPAFALGLLHVDPSRRQVKAGTSVEILEPRVMQVLVLLSHARGLVVSRDDLIQSSWGGRIVGDDAINRVLGKIRQVAAGIGADSFTVETVVKVGYRLVERKGAADSPEEAAATAAAALPPRAEDNPLVTRRRAFAFGGAGILAAAGGLWWSQAGPSVDPEAERNFQRGLALRGQSDIEQTEQSVAFMREAIRIQPDYAAAWGALAWGYRSLLEYGPRPDRARIESLARAAALRAQQLDPGNVDARLAILLLRPFYRRWSEIETGCRRLLTAEADNGLVSFNLAWVLMETGRFGEAQPIFEALIREQPFWPLLFVRQAQVLHTLGRVEEAEHLLDGALRRWPRHPELWFNRLRLYTLSGQLDRTAAFASDRANRPPLDERPVEIELLLARTIGKSRAEREAAVENMLSLAQGPGQLIGIAISAPLLGQADVSIEMLQGYYFGRGRWARIHSERLRTGFLFASASALLRHHPGFMPLVREIGLVDHWRSTGKLPDFLRRR